MNEEIRVNVNSYGPSRCLGLVWTDPVSGRKKAKSSGTTDWREAERRGGELKAELRAGRGGSPSKITWQQFRQRYIAEHVASLAPKTADAVRGAFAHVERHLNPDRLCKLDAPALSRLQSKLRATGVQETTIASVLRQLRAALGWAASMELLPGGVPKIIMPKRAKGRAMKGGALVGEQFDRMLAAVPKVRPQDAGEWQRFLTGSWLSGLRLGEAVILSWDADSPFGLDLTGKHPRFRIKGEVQKSGKDELLPMTPDAAAFFLATPPEQRHGRVFRLNAVATRVPLKAHHVGKVVAKIGKAARVVVNATEGKTASCHDLRRSFATRWARRVAPAVLQRYASFEHPDHHAVLRGPGHRRNGR